MGSVGAAFRTFAEMTPAPLVTAASGSVGPALRVDAEIETAPRWIVAPGKVTETVSKFPWIERWIAAFGREAALVSRFAEIVFLAVTAAFGKVGVAVMT